MFKDGSKVRAARADLPSLLDPTELGRVQRGFGHRKWFVRNILPPWARSVALAVITLAVAAGGIKAMSSVIRPTHPVAVTTPQATPAPTRSTSPAPTPSPSPTTAVLGAAATPTPIVPASAPPSPDPVTRKLHHPAPATDPPVPGLVRHIVAPVTATLGKLGL